MLQNVEFRVKFSNGQMAQAFSKSISVILGELRMAQIADLHKSFPTLYLAVYLRLLSLTLSHSEWQKVHRVFAILSAIGLI